MAAATEERYVFVVEWFDQVASLVRRYQLTFFPSDDTIEMYDLKMKRIFLKRSQTGTKLKDLYLGATVTVWSRQLKVVEYADVFTRKNFEVQRSHTFAMIKPDAYTNIGKILDAVQQSGFLINKLQMVRFSQSDAQEFYGEHVGKPFFPALIDFVTSDVVVGVELISENAVQKWRTLIGPTSTQMARVNAPNSLRALFGTDQTKNAVHGSDAATTANREVDFFFNPMRLRPTALLNNCSCLVIKPHALQNGSAGKIIDWVLEEGFEVSAMKMFYLDRPSAEEFFEVYKGVLPEFVPMVEHMITGPCIAMEVRQENVVKSLRELVGPHDPEIAKHLRPNTIRAKFGLDRVRNAVHCTDLPEDGVLECEYFFSILQDQ